MLDHDINSAPKNGIPILTEVGIVRWENEHPYMNRWIACKPNGDAFEVEVEGDTCRFTMNPTMWMELPLELSLAVSTQLDQELGLWDASGNPLKK